MRKKLVIESFIVYMLSAGIDCMSIDVYEMIEKVDECKIDEEAKARRLRRYIEDLKQIGALKPDARVRTLEEGISGISAKDYSLNLINYADVDDCLKHLYRVTKILNSECGDNPRSDDTVDKFKKMYFSNGLEFNANTKYDLVMSVSDIWDMINLYEPENKIEKQRFDNVFSIIMKIKCEHGYNVVNSQNKYDD